MLFRMTLRSPGLLGEALKRRRKLLGWSQTELAHRSGVQQKNLSAIENGVQGVRMATLFKVMAAMNLEVVIQDRPIVSLAHKE
jgi:HTH-type transcriptional regulator/antitoxin HipB